MKLLDQQTSVSGQITVADIDQLVELGVEILVCNRPDNEAKGQPLYSDIASVALNKAIEVVNIPFSAGQMTPEQVEEFAALLKQGKRIHAYCRTGNRCTQIWTAATQ
ncbi:TIGR01244 family protein [Candidatus Endobugula sertula]|uniref:TIGR01244 family protein n=1 Tax=Candidatus Endobugula sertula TaxID=62101 RepID=A0A1D2QMR4_9GAMM|nr:TIGR01244 family protein [Candidatus Endobugula sertula]